MSLSGSEIVNLLISLVIFLLLGAYVGVMHFVGPFKRAFFCSDLSIRYPYQPDTVSMLLAAGIGVAIILLPVVVVEIVRHALKLNRASQSDRAYASSGGCLGCFSGESQSALAMVSIARVLLLAAFGILVTEVVTVTLKTILGRHRPHFLALCQPNRTAERYRRLCDDNSPIPVDVCTADSEDRRFQDSMMSFPSGHSSHSMYMTVFASLYLQSRFTFAKGHAVKWFLQCLILVWGLGVCASRVSDYKHHWSDVLGGGLIGVIVGLIVSLYLRPTYLSCSGSNDAADADEANPAGA